MFLPCCTTDYLHLQQNVNFLATVGLRSALYACAALRSGLKKMWYCPDRLLFEKLPSRRTEIDETVNADKALWGSKICPTNGSVFYFLNFLRCEIVLVVFVVPAEFRFFVQSCRCMCREYCLGPLFHCANRRCLSADSCQLLSIAHLGVFVCDACCCVPT